MNEQIAFVDKQILSVACSIMKVVKPLKWTANVIDLVELVYSFYEAKCFGTASLKDLFSEISSMFDCDIKSYYRLFWDIRNRVKENRATFLTKLHKALTDKMDKMDE